MRAVKDTNFFSGEPVNITLLVMPVCLTRNIIPATLNPLLVKLLTFPSMTVIAISCAAF